MIQTGLADIGTFCSLMKQVDVAVANRHGRGGGGGGGKGGKDPQNPPKPKAFTYDLPTLERLAQNNDDPDLSFWIGNHYLMGWGTGRDVLKAVDWFKKSAIKGNAQGLAHLEYLLGDEDVSADHVVRALLEVARSNVNADLWKKIGDLYVDGAVVPSNFKKAQIYYSTGLSMGDSECADRLDDLEQRIQAQSTSRPRRRPRRTQSNPVPTNPVPAQPRPDPATESNPSLLGALGSGIKGGIKRYLASRLKDIAGR